MIKEIDPDGSGHFDYTSVVALLEKHWKTPANPKDVIEAFKIFDPDNTGKIKTAELRTVMTSLGEKLTQEEVQALIKEADPKNEGVIVYTDRKETMLVCTCDYLRVDFVNNMAAQTQTVDDKE
ncbi:calmoduline [Reticulomyxa filosa]|uniref:Calmodulin n=1 Tax=Reticulomyxa filosa TaxID=46433 RepID=X6MEY1_RETFI|nr:calmoduline [Reticulomyxa filosa]|eukprot:ETO11962.1 calmoduline [Reticulomyxa filosa]